MSNAVLASRDPAAESPEEEQASWFFIVGCQRSGTTLMRLILECHSRIQCCDEFRAYRVLAGGLRLPRERPLVGFKVPRLTEQFGNAVFREIAAVEVRNHYRQQPLIFMVRDVRDTVASMLRLQLRGRSWLEAFGIPALKQKMHEDPAFRARYELLFGSLEAARNPLLASAALCWRYKVEALFEYLAKGYPVLLVRYEDLVARPAVELIRVCGFLRVPWEPGLLTHAAFPHDELVRGMAIGNTDPSRPIDNRSVEQWRGFFSEEELSEIAEFAGPPQSALYSCQAEVAALKA